MENKMKDRIGELKASIRMHEREKKKTIYTIDATVEQMLNEIDFIESNILK